jgi:hypothetical protein
MVFVSSDVDKVHDIMDDIAEQHDISREITDAISNNVAFPNDIDEDELAKELEDLEQVEYSILVKGSLNGSLTRNKFLTKSHYFEIT